MKLLLVFVKEHKSLAALGLVLGLIVAVLEAITAALMMPLILFLSTTSNASGSGYSQMTNSIMSFFESVPEQHKFTAIVVAILVLTVMKNLSLYFSNISINRLMLDVGISLRRRCVEFFLTQKLCFYSKSRMGDLLSCVNEQVQRSEMLVALMISMVNSLFIITFLMIFLIMLSPGLTAFVVVTIGVLGLSLRKVFRSVAVSGNKAASSIGNFSSVITEIISGMRVIKARNGQAAEIRRSDIALKERYDAELTAWMRQSAVGPSTETVGTILVLSILAAGAFIYSNQADVLPLVAAYLIALMRLWPRLTHLAGVRAQVSQLGGSLTAISDMLSKSDLVETADGETLFQGMQFQIDFENVTYAFPGNDVPAICNLTLRIKKGSVVALVGPSGSGKSTLADLLMGFDEPQEGKITVDGIDLRNISRGTWRRAIGLVSQDTFLFNASVRDNIAYGMDSISESEIIAAAKNAYAYEFIQNLPNGFATIVGDRGTMLSGGQRQRIAIARAIIHHSEILIFDEATSALDTASEKSVQSAIELASKDRTVLVIAHRLSTIRQADMIVFMKHGKILEQGSYQELMDRGGDFFKLQQGSGLSGSSQTGCIDASAEPSSPRSLLERAAMGVRNGG
ncbi:MAG: ABC transporter ATP-binding protein [Gallionella sp.]|nr:ABC transporter ATP-binding protein [Gallionella sp.]